jgi:hypothetical protein
VAFLVRGDISRGGQKDGNDQTPRKGGLAQQQIVVASHLKNIITPLEKAGYAVDVFISYYACKEAEVVVGWYNQGRKRVISHIAGDAKLSYAKNKGAQYANIFMGVVHYDQGFLIGEVARLLKRHILQQQVVYASVLLWRHDFAILQPLDESKIRQLHTHRFTAQEDVAYTFPWWMVAAFVHIHGTTVTITVATAAPQPPQMNRCHRSLLLPSYPPTSCPPILSAALYCLKAPPSAGLRGTAGCAT